jgi:hypothetical protein
MKFIVQPWGTVEDETGKVIYQSSIDQQDAREVLHQTVQENGWSTVEEWEMDDDSIELTVKKCQS